MDLAQTQGKRWQRMLQYEHEQRLRLEEMVEQLAKQHSLFEKQARRKLASSQGKADGTSGSNLQGIHWIKLLLFPISQVWATFSSQRAKSAVRKAAGQALFDFMNRGLRNDFFPIPLNRVTQ